MNNLSIGVIAANALALANDYSDGGVVEIDYDQFLDYRNAIYSLYLEKKMEQNASIVQVLKKMGDERDRKEFEKDFSFSYHDDKCYLTFDESNDIFSIREWYLGLVSREEYDLLNCDEAISILGINKEEMQQTRKRVK